MTSANRIHHLLYRGPKVLADPGDGETITPTADLQICEMVSLTTETRTLSRPTKPGIRFVLRLLTAGGTVTVTATGGLNSSLETEATFAEESDFLSLISVTTVANTTYRWEILEGNAGTVISSNTVSSTPSATVSSTPSTTPSGTKSSTPSATASVHEVLYAE